MARSDESATLLLYGSDQAILPGPAISDSYKKEPASRPQAASQLYRSFLADSPGAKALPRSELLDGPEAVVADGGQYGESNHDLKH